MAKQTTKTYKKKTGFDINDQFGKLPPQAIDIEMDVLGALMLERGKDIVVLDILTPDSFYKTEHQKIFKAIYDLSVNHQPIDYHTIIEKLKSNGNLEEVGGPAYVISLSQRVGSAAHIEYHSKIIAEKFIQRELIRVSSEIQKRSFDDTEDVNDLLEFSQQQMFELALGSVKRDAVKIDLVLNDAITQIEEARNREDGLSGVPSGFSSLDRITSGWQNSDLVIIAARPSMGKTAFVLTMARNISVNHGKSVALFSLEMSSIQLVTRLISSETELGSEKLRSGNLKEHEWQQLEHKIKGLEKAKIYIDDTPAISLFEIRSKCRKLKTRENIDLIVIDYLQLMSGPPETRGNREQEVSTISRGLKAIAKELNLPIIALSQLNRSVEMRSGLKRPQLSDLRESGAIEQDADIVMFIHRPEKMGLTEDEAGNSTRGLAQIIIAKHRNGAVTDIDLRFREEFARFEEFNEAFLQPIEGEADGGNKTSFESKMNNDDDYFDSLNNKKDKDKDVFDKTGFDNNDGDTPF
ncbi:MAG: replicative DNA helicase [Bacteroidales bacterium]|nr:replicative DNA helicase [Bacteroidales bacterium]